MDTDNAKSSENVTASFEPPSGGPSQSKEVLLSQVPASIQRIHVDGLVRTKDDIVTKHIQALFAARNFEEMVALAHMAKMRLEMLGLFKSVGISIDISRGAKATATGYDVTYSVEEQRRVTGVISTLVGTNEGGLLLSMRLPNTLGRGERIYSDFTYSSKNAIGWNLNFSKPVNGNPAVNVNAGVFQTSSDLPWSGYKALDRGITAGYTFPSVLGSHTLRWEGTWRDLGCLTKTTAIAVREQCGHSLKSAIQHVWLRDTRDSRILPNTGYMIKTVHEVAGLGGDTDYFKQEAELQINKTLLWDSVVQLSLAGGVINPIRSSSTVNIQDRFFLGGPLTLRGFNMRGAGPHQDGCSLGGEAYWCAGAHLYTPLPFRPGRGGFGDYFRTHFFIGAGNLTSIDRNLNWKENISTLGESLRLSYGAGIVLRMGGIARLEVNYCVPIIAQKGDSINHGLQFGVGISFL